MEAEEMRLMGQLIQKLSQRDIAAIFNQPVMASEYPDYHQIVSTPMDLGTIQENIRQGAYHSLEACAKDVRTVWTNAYLYNPAKSVVAQGARALSKVFEGMYNKINPSDFNYEREPNTDERNKLSRDIYRVEDSQLAGAVTLLEQRCPGAVVRDNEEGYFVIKVESLPSIVFWEVELYLRKRLCNQPDRTKKKIPTTFRPPPDSMARLSCRKRDNGDGVGGGVGTGDGNEGRDDSTDRAPGAKNGGGGNDGGADKKRKTEVDGGGAAVAAAVTTATNGNDSQGVVADGSGGGNGNARSSNPSALGSKTPAAAATAPDRDPSQPAPAPANGSGGAAGGIAAGRYRNGSSGNSEGVVAMTADTMASVNSAGSTSGGGGGGGGTGVGARVGTGGWKGGLPLADTSFREAGGGSGSVADGATA
ncbi:unnamed protein product [Scytosiphon promiscuus]